MLPFVPSQRYGELFTHGTLGRSAGECLDWLTRWRGLVVPARGIANRSGRGVSTVHRALRVLEREGLAAHSEGRWMRRAESQASLRGKAMRRIWEGLEEPARQCELAKKLGLAPWVVARALRLLAERGLVRREESGWTVGPKDVAEVATRWDCEVRAERRRLRHAAERRSWRAYLAGLPGARQ